jgi:Flp pilus assembly pilin Flp
MLAAITKIWSEDDGVLSFEWTLLLTLLTIGIVGGIAAARDAIIDELGDVAEAAQGIDQSYSLSGVVITGVFSSASSDFIEGPEDAVVIDCARATAPVGQPGQVDTDS